MPEIYRIPTWILAEYWEMKFFPDNKPNIFEIVIFGKTGCSYTGQGVSIAHAAKEAFKARRLNDSQLSTKRQISPPENTTEQEQSPETNSVGDVSTP